MSDTPKIMEGTPEVIYLQTGDAGDEDMTFAELGDVTWAEDCIAHGDTKYIRADVVERENAALRAELEGVRKDAERYRHVRNNPAMLLHLSNRDFDAAIDAAIAKEGK